MKPRTKIQKEVDALSRKLRPLNKRDIHWAERNVPYFVGYEHNGKVTCMHCGTKFSHKGDDTQMCPHCRRTLHVQQSLARTFKDTECFLLADSAGDWQVLRYFHVITTCAKRGKETDTYIDEVMQRWIDSNGRYIVRSVSRGLYNRYWLHGTEMEIRNAPKPYAYCKWDDESYCELRMRKQHPRLRYVPYDHDVFGSYFNYCNIVFLEPYAETLYKKGCKNVLKRCIDFHLFKHKDAMAAIKVAQRHGYDIEGCVQEWFDYLDTLRSLGVDVRNPKIICPDDLNAAEAKYLRILNKREEDRERIRTRQQRIERLERDKKLNGEYVKRFGKLFGVVIEQGDISIHVLRNVSEFAKEGDALHHCVYAMGYYDTEKHPHSLILDASVRGKRTETIEVDTRDFHIVQARGACNQDSKWHKEIVELMNSNMDKLKTIAA